MSHLVESPIKSMTTVHRRPAWFIWRGLRYDVAQILDRWVLTGEWWEEKPECVYWRIRDARGGVYEIYHEQDGARRWVMYKVYD